MCLQDPNQNSVVCIATLHGLKFWGSNASILRDFLHQSSPASKLTHILQNGKRFSFPEIKLPGRDIDAPSHPALMLGIGRSISLAPLCLNITLQGRLYLCPRTLINLWKKRIHLNYLYKPVPTTHVTLRFSIVTTRMIEFSEIIIAYSNNKIKIVRCVGKCSVFWTDSTYYNRCGIQAQFIVLQDIVRTMFGKIPVQADRLTFYWSQIIAIHTLPPPYI